MTSDQLIYIGVNLLSIYSKIIGNYKQQSDVKTIVLNIQNNPTIVTTLNAILGYQYGIDTLNNVIASPEFEAVLINLI